MFVRFLRVIAKGERNHGQPMGGSSKELNAKEPASPNESTNKLTWPPLVEAWEPLKSPRTAGLGSYERIPESDLRNFIATQYGGKADDLTLDEIKGVVLELCLHCDSFLMISSESTDQIQ